MKTEHRGIEIDIITTVGWKAIVGDKEYGNFVRVKSLPIDKVKEVLKDNARETIDALLDEREDME